MSDSSSDSSNSSPSDSGCSSTDEHEPSKKLQSLQQCPEWIKLAELMLVMVPYSIEDERMFFALKYLKSPQRNSLKEKHTNVCARGFIMEYDFMSIPYPDAIGRWLYAKKKRGRYGL
eukprot:927563-Pelagomonas_calceolata.AAC.8